MKKRRKKKKHTLRTWLMIGAVGILLSNMAFATAPTDILINQSKVPFTAQSGRPFLDEQERTQVPLRITMETFGCTVSWEEASQSALLKKGDTTVQVPVGKDYLLVNGEKRPNDTSALIKDGRTYLPIRSVLEAFGAQVHWDGERNAILVTTPAAEGAEMQVHFIDVGQADAILIDYGEYEVLIDGGNNKDGKTVVSYLRSYVDGPLEVLIATHPDADHIGGLDDVLAAYDVKQIIDSGSAKDTKTYDDYWKAAQAEPNCQVLADKDMTLSLGNNANLSIIETGDGYQDANDNSVVARLQYGEVSLLLTGDMEKTAEEAALALRKFPPSTVLKAGHHGSSTSSSQAFLEQVQPKYAVISAGKDNPYRHPHKSTLERFFENNITVYGTFRSGDIILTTDGKNLSFNTTDTVLLTDAGDAKAS